MIQVVLYAVILGVFIPSAIMMIVAGDYWQAIIVAWMGITVAGLARIADL